jgi:glycine/D-amino acid oxidase-like deaminating enzyme
MRRGLDHHTHTCFIDPDRRMHLWQLPLRQPGQCAGAGARVPGVVAATGHSRHGVLLTPITAQELVRYSIE